jgi:hypothetical protein
MNAEITTRAADLAATIAARPRVCEYSKQELLHLLEVERSRARICGTVRWAV